MYIRNIASACINTTKPTTTPPPPLTLTLTHIRAHTHTQRERERSRFRIHWSVSHTHIYMQQCTSTRSVLYVQEVANSATSPRLLNAVMILASLKRHNTMRLHLNHTLNMVCHRYHPRLPGDSTMFNCKIWRFVQTNMQYLAMKTNPNPCTSNSSKNMQAIAIMPVDISMCTNWLRAWSTVISLDAFNIG